MRAGGGVNARGVATRRLLAAAAAAVSLATLAAGCGDDKSSAEEWADGVCSAFSDWRDAVTTAGEELRLGATTKDDLQTTADDLEEATNELVDDIRDLDDLETEGGQEAQAALDQLAENVDQNKEDIQSTVSGASDLQDVVQAVSSIASTVALMGQQLQSTFQQLEQIDAGSELSDAFENSDACKSLSE